MEQQFDYDFDELRRAVTKRLMEEQAMDFDEAWSTAPELIRTGCRFNHVGIECFTKRDCLWCGFNPEVSAQRKRNIWPRKPGTEKPVGIDKRVLESVVREISRI